ncbi:MAG: hypothetical protein K9K86_08165 [Pseudomonadales bacterium]|nr:hypothetical protein [Pseudomonadales bacterium]
MKKILAPVTFALCAFCASYTFAESCSEPSDVQLPDGASATTDEMVAGQQAVKKYIADGEAFLGCMEEAEEANADSLSDEVKKANVERYNAVVDKMQVLAQNFNEQIKAYKAAQAEQ